MLYIDFDGNLVNTDDSELVNLWGYLAEVRLYKGENPLKTNRGIDYTGVLNGETFLKDTVEDCTKRYTNKFKSVSIGDVSQKGEIVSVAVSVTRFDNEVTEFNVGVNTGNGKSAN